MLVTSFADFGSNDKELYARYLSAEIDNVRCARDYLLVGRGGVPSGDKGVFESFERRFVDAIVRNVDRQGLPWPESAVDGAKARSGPCGNGAVVGGIFERDQRNGRGDDGGSPSGGKDGFSGQAPGADDLSVGCESALESVAIRTEDLKPELVFDIQDGDVVSGSGLRGPNWARNRAAREKKKRQKQLRKGVQCVEGGEQTSVGSVGHGSSSPTAGAVSGRAFAVRDLTRVDQEGFWNSCSKDVRQELIDSKARMHIAENLRKAKQAEEEVKKMESPEALLVRAMGMVSMAERCAKKKNDSKVAGWAETVATSYAESIAKSAPSSVPSYASVLSGSLATSVSVDGTKRAKPQAPTRKLKTYEGDPQHPAKSYYEKRIKYTNSLIGLDGILDELHENKALAALDKTWLINDCYLKKQRYGGAEVFG